MPQLRAVGGVPVVGADIPLATPAGSLAPDVHGDLGPRDPWGVPASSMPQLGYRGELEAAGLVWLRHRAYDPATASFLSADPLPPVPGGPVSPFAYAAGDPIRHRDPLGLSPVSDADVALMAQADDRSWLDDAWGWVADHGDEIAAGALAVGAVALVATGVGAPIGAGILIGMGVSAGAQYLTTGEVDARGLWVSGLAGGLSAGVGSAVAGAGGGIVAQGAAGVGTGAVSSVGSQALVTGRVDPGQVALDSVVGGVGGLAGPAIGQLRGGVEAPPPIARSAPQPSALPAGPTPTAATAAPVVPVTSRTGSDFVAGPGPNSVIVPTSRTRLEDGLTAAGFPSVPAGRPGTIYTLPDGGTIRVMEPTVNAPLRASFENANGQPVSAITGRTVQPPGLPPGLSKAEARELRLEYIRSRTHVELNP